jgi:hypothetical protein
MMEEEWKDIKGYEGLYKVSSIGRVKSINRITKCKNGHLRPFKETMLSMHPNNHGYMSVILCKNNKAKTTMVHRLVAETFIPNHGNKSEVNHLDGNKSNNCVSNLEWCTKEENMNHSRFVLGNKPVNLSGKHARNNKPIALINAENGKRIKIFYSRNYAAKILGYNAGYIGKAANYGLVIGRYKFEYLKKNEKNNI